MSAVEGTLTGCRVSGLAVGQLIATMSAASSHDKSWSEAVRSIWEMLVVFTSVLCAIVPRTQKFWSDLQSGGAKIHNTNSIELSSGGRYAAGSSGQFGDKSWPRSQIRPEAGMKGRWSIPPQPRGSEDSESELVKAVHGDPMHSMTRVRGGPSRADVRADDDSGNTITHTVEFSMREERL